MRRWRALSALFLLVVLATSCSRTTSGRHAPGQATKAELGILASVLGAVMLENPASAPADVDEFARMAPRQGFHDERTGLLEPDEWGRPLVLLRGKLRPDADLYAFGSAGADGAWGTPDDLLATIEVKAQSGLGDRTLD